MVFNDQKAQSSGQLHAISLHTCFRAASGLWEGQLHVFLLRESGRFDSRSLRCSLAWRHAWREQSGHSVPLMQ